MVLQLKKTLSILLSLGCIHFLFAQPAAPRHKQEDIDRGLVVYKLGKDTTTIQYFEYERRKFTTTILALTGQAVKYEASGELDEKGEIRQVRSKIFRFDSSGSWFLASEGLNTFKGDSSIYTSTSNGKLINRRAVAGKGIVSNSADASSFFVFPYMGFFAPVKIGDTLFHCQLVFGECRTYQVARQSKNELKIGSTVMGMIRLFIDQKGRMTGADGVGSSLNFVATVERGNKNHNQFIDLLAKRKFASGSFAARIFRDTARITINTKKIEVDYWRPYARGREIFGSVVPWNRIWRTGANNATQLRTEAVLFAGGEKLLAGKYSLWIYPTESNWQLLINKKADVWGTEYDPGSDILKLPLTVERKIERVEVFKISLIPQPNSIVRIQIEWDDHKAWADFTVIDN